MTPEDRRAARAIRDAAICAYYAEGHRLKDCASHFRLGRMRTLQILKANDVWKPYTKSDRTTFLGVNLSPETKDALRVKAGEQGVSVSRFASDVLDEVVAKDAV